MRMLVDARRGLEASEVLILAAWHRSRAAAPSDPFADWINVASRRREQ
jgi:hypothetical protein